MSAISAPTDKARVPLLIALLGEHLNILRFCRSRLPSRQDAEDACQETYLRAIQKLDTLLDHENPTGWLYTTARNCCRSVLRRRERDERLPRRGSRHEQEASSPASSTSPRAKIYQDHEDQRRAEADEDVQDRAEAKDRIERLPESLRDVARLVLEGFSRREIATRLDISENAVDIRMHRIKRRYREEER